MAGRCYDCKHVYIVEGGLMSGYYCEVVPYIKCYEARKDPNLCGGKAEWFIRKPREK